MRSRSIRTVAAIVALAGALVLVPARPALARTCSLAVQQPYTLNRLTIRWGTLLACDSPIVAAFYSGQLQRSDGIPVDMRATPGQIPWGGTMQFWMNEGPCPLPTAYRSVILSVTVYMADGTVATLPFQSSVNRFVDCIL